MRACLEEIWTSILEELRRTLPPAQFKTWFRQASPVGLDSSTLRIGVPNRFFWAWMTAHYKRAVEAAATKVLGRSAAVEFTLLPDRALPAIPESALENEAAGDDLASSQEAIEYLAGSKKVGVQEFSGAPLNEHYTFENFVVGECNRLAYAAARSVSEAPGGSYNPLFIHGPVGVGKTHLLQAICRAARERNYKAAYLSCEEFIHRLIEAIQTRKTDEFRWMCRSVNILAIDDIHFLARAETSQEEFFHTFNSLYNGEKQIVLSSDMPPKNLESIQERIVSRFGCGFVVRIEPPSVETRAAIARAKAEMRGVNLPPEIIDLIARHSYQSVREIEGAIVRVVGYAALSQRPITLELAKSVIEENVGLKKRVSVSDVIRAVANHFGVRVSELQSRRRNRLVAFPRQVCMHLLRSLTDYSLEEIGGYFGGRDHTTVLYADQKIRSALEKDSQLREMINKIVNHLSLEHSSK